MQKLIDSYLMYLSSHPEAFLGIQVYTAIMTPFLIIMFMYRKKMIDGATGQNSYWEVPEQYGYIAMWIVFPIVTFSACFRYDLPQMMWYFIYGLVMYIIGGRWLFEWALALRAGSTKVEQSQTTTVSEKIEVTKEEIKQ